jgi:hypothetical protein
MRVFFLALILVGLVNHAFARGREACDQRADFSAEMEVGSLKKWDDVYKSFRRFAKCDDGSIAEGFSDSVVHLLATQWSSLPQAATIANKHPSFKKFFLQHIDATADMGELRNIEIFSRTNCPSNLKQLCVVIGEQANKAIADDMSANSKPQ